tara:strand:+ start:341 stop:967 length:627 start_codon:yes stop_codon:yes gene_type:complete
MAIIKGLHAKITSELLKDVLEEKGYAFFDGNKPLNLNIIGIRNSSRDSTRFDDTMLLIYREEDTKEWIVHSYQVTTEPGPAILRKPVNSAGTAVLVPNQYRGVYKIDTHSTKNRHIALCQRLGKVRVYRDDDRDSKPEETEVIQEGMFGINIHRHAGSNEREYVRGSSAGCQVFKDSKDFAEFMLVCNKSADMYGNAFTYTLLEEGDL